MQPASQLLPRSSHLRARVLGQRRQCCHCTGVLTGVTRVQCHALQPGEGIKQPAAARGVLARAAAAPSPPACARRCAVSGGGGCAEQGGQQRGMGHQVCAARGPVRAHKAAGEQVAFRKQVIHQLQGQGGTDGGMASTVSASCGLLIALCKAGGGVLRADSAARPALTSNMNSGGSAQASKAPMMGLGSSIGI